MPRTVPQPAPSALGGLPGLLGPAFLSQQAMEMLLVRQFNQKVGETSGVYRSNFFFFFLLKMKEEIQPARNTAFACSFST